jgi:hypothetical protein
MKPNEKHVCSYCLKPIVFIRLNNKLSAGACRTPNCIHGQRIHVKGPKYMHLINIEGDTDHR